MSYQRGGRFQLSHQQSSCSFGDCHDHDCCDHDHDVEILKPDHSCPSRQSTLFSATFNLVASIIGGGVLSLPLAFEKCGIVLATIMMIFSAIITDFSLYILCSSARRTGSQSYGEVARAAFGAKMDIFTTFLLFVFLLFVIVAFMVLVRGIWTPIVLEIVSYFDFSQKPTSSTTHDSLSVAKYQNRILFAIIVMMLPCLLQKNLHALRYNCYVGFISITVLALAIIYRAMEVRTASSSQDLTILWFTDNFADALYAFPIITLAFLCSFNIHQIQNSIYNPTRQRLRSVIHSSVAVCFVLMYIFGLAGYLYSGRKTMDNILMNFDVTDRLIFLGRIGCGTNLMLNMAIVTLPCRDSMLALWPLFKEWSNNQKNHTLEEKNRQNETSSEESSFEIESLPNNTSCHHHCNEDSPLVSSSESRSSEESYFVEIKDVDMEGSSNVDKDNFIIFTSTLGIALACYLAAACAPGVGIVWSICGSSMAFIIAFILPCACYIQVRCKKIGHRNHRILASWFILIFSVIGAIACTAQTIWRLFFMTHVK